MCKASRRSKWNSKDSALCYLRAQCQVKWWLLESSCLQQQASSYRYGNESVAWKEAICRTDSRMDRS